MFTPLPEAAPTVADVRSAYLGEDTDCTVYSREFQGLDLALEMIAEDGSDL